MKDCARLYNCVRCRCQVVICRDCDRGNLYCFDGCADQARTESLRAAGRRYQSTRQGRHQHAERQRRYRRRLADKVTQQGSPLFPLSDVLHLALERRRESGDSPVVPSSGAMQCHGCGCYCSPFVRLTLLRGRYPRSGHRPRASSRSVRRSSA